LFILPLNENSTGSLASTAELTVRILAKPAPKLRWLKDNKELVIKDRLKVETSNIENNEDLKEYKLIISGVQAIDAGAYKLEASNNVGTDVTQTKYEVIGL